jgi:3D (Asp-Asp-Asp) domain-containing protein
MRLVAGLVVAALLVDPAVAAAERKRSRGRTVRMEATAYCIEGETASGAQTRRGIVAADPDVLPLGTRIRVDGLGRRLSRTYHVEDTGRLVKGREIDIFMDSCAAAKEFGRRPARVRIIRLGDNTRVSERSSG